MPIPFLETPKVIRWFRPNRIDGFVDKIHYSATAAIIAVAAVVASGRQNFGHPIECFCPAQFNQEWIAFTKEICFANGTFYLPNHERLPNEQSHRDVYRTSTYQYVPFILALQAILFFVPSWIWTTFHRRNGMDMSLVVEDLKKLQQMIGDEANKFLLEIGTDLEEQLEIRENLTSTRRFFCFQMSSIVGIYMNCLYFLVKLLYLINVIAQYYIIDLHMSDSHPPFPLIAICEFQVRLHAVNQQHTIECVLGVNAIHLKIYTFLWYWLPILAIITIIGTSTSLINMCLRWNVISYLNEYTDTPEMKHHVSKFICHGLCHDGALLMSFIESNCGSRIAKTLTVRMFRNYLEMASRKRGRITLLANGIEKDFEQQKAAEL